MANAKAYSSLFDDDDFEEEDQDLDDELQRVVNDYQPRPVPHTEDVSGPAESTSQPFATTDNLDSSIAYLSSTLSAFGFPSELPLRSGSSADIAKVCNLLYAMLHQRQRDIERHRDTDDGLARLESSFHSAEQARQRMEARLLAKEKEIGGLENKLRTVETLSRSETTKLVTELAELQKANVDLQRRHVQFQHELRRKDREFERLQAKLHDVLTEKKRESKANLDAANRFIDTGSRATAPRRDDDLYKKIVANYEEKQREVLAENSDLRKALEGLQIEIKAMNNQQVQRAQQLAAVKKTVNQEFVEEVADLTPLGLEAKLRAKLEHLRGLSDTLNKDSIAASPQDKVRSARDTQMVSNQRAARRIIADYEALSQIAIESLCNSGRPVRESTPIGDGVKGLEDGTSPSVQRLEEDYRAKVVELESKMATAQLQGKGTGNGEDSFKAQFEEERRCVDKARLALVEEKARIAKLLEQQGERLQQEAFDLGQARWEFENTRSAFHETMRQFAPGFGAGTFLAKAIAKRSALAAKERSNNEQVTAAGKRAADAIKLEGNLSDRT